MDSPTNFRHLLEIDLLNAENDAAAEQGCAAALAAEPPAAAVLVAADRLGAARMALPKSKGVTIAAVLNPDGAEPVSAVADTATALAFGADGIVLVLADAAGFDSDAAAQSRHMLATVAELCRSGQKRLTVMVKQYQTEEQLLHVAQTAWAAGCDFVSFALPEDGSTPFAALKEHLPAEGAGVKIWGLADDDAAEKCVAAWTEVFGSEQLDAQHLRLIVPADWLAAAQA